MEDGARPTLSLNTALDTDEARPFAADDDSKELREAPDKIVAPAGVCSVSEIIAMTGFLYILSGQPCFVW